MTRIDITDLEAQFEAIIERCANGESFLIIVDGVESCVLLPIAEYDRLREQTGDPPVDE